MRGLIVTLLFPVVLGAGLYEPTPMDKMIGYALSFQGTPYELGGQNRLGIDCSGFVVEVLKYAQVFKEPDFDTNAYGLFSIFMGNGITKTNHRGAIAIYGTGYTRIRHVAIALGNGNVIDASGNSVRVRSDDYRKDLIGYIRPIYPWEQR